MGISACYLMKDTWLNLLYYSKSPKLILSTLSRPPIYICSFKLFSLQTLARLQKVPSHANTSAFQLYCSLAAVTVKLGQQHKRQLLQLAL